MLHKDFFYPILPYFISFQIGKQSTENAENALSFKMLFADSGISIYYKKLGSN